MLIIVTSYISIEFFYKSSARLPVNLNDPFIFCRENKEENDFAYDTVQVVFCPSSVKTCSGTSYNTVLGSSTYFGSARRVA